MTGFGEAQSQQQALTVAVEVRTVNSRYFKLNIRSSDGFGLLDTQIESLVRKFVKRGTIQVQLKIQRERTADDVRINAEVLTSYRRQLESITDSPATNEPVRIDALLALPGVVEDNAAARRDATEDWPLVEATLAEALKNLTQMRRDEGAAMSADLTVNGRTIVERLEKIEVRAPLVVDGYRQRLTDRVKKTLDELGVNVEPHDLIRDVSLFAERSDISEEIVRLRSHLDQFEQILADDGSAGRKLEFLVQEMGRETNTIGSKANDVEIARDVIEIKAALERIREQIQNVE
jgi:uncharacterized protein (TIGR00255 family)